jgi:hypothetical protein
LAPSAVYNGNRYRVLPIPYPPYIYDKKDKPLDMPITVTNIIRLNVDKSPAKIEMLTGNCSTPLLSFYDSKAKRGWIMLTTQGTQFGNSGLMIEENASKETATFVLSAPGVREARYVMTGFAKSTDKPVDLKTGEEISLKMRLYNFTANNLQDFYEKVFSIRKALSGTTVYRNVAPFSAITDIILDHHDKTKYYEDNKYGYICNNPNGNSPWNHVGGLVYSYPQVIQSTPERLRRISKTFDVFKLMQGKTGLLYGMFMKGKLFGDNFNENETKPTIAMVRKNGDVLYFGIQTLELLKVQGKENYIKPEWNEVFKKLADGIVKVWKDYGQFGQFVDVETGEMDINGSTAGAVCISGLALASRYFQNPEYLRIAEAAGEYYYNRDLLKGYLGGGPQEILQCPDSEAAYDITDAYTTLYEITGKKEWLKYARAAAAIFSTWTVSYDYKFPKGSTMHRIDARSTGAVWASTQNAHGAPGIYILSGNFLLRLYRATSDKRYMELLKDIAHNIVQYTTTKNNPVIPKAIMQNPGIYLRNDIGDMFVFDNVEAIITKHDKKGVNIRITNSTPYDARVSVFSENSKQAKKTLSFYAFTQWQKIEVNAGETKEFFIENK